MAQIVVLDAGLRGAIAAFDLRDTLGACHTVSVVTRGSHLHLVKTNQWVGVGWRGGCAQTGFMIETMVTAAVHNICRLIKGQQSSAIATWNAVYPSACGDGGIAFVAQTQIPPLNVNWSSSGKWVHLAKSGFEKYVLHKIRSVQFEPFYAWPVLQALGMNKMKKGRA